MKPLLHYVCLENFGRLRRQKELDNKKYIACLTSQIYNFVTAVIITTVTKKYTIGHTTGGVGSRWRLGDDGLGESDLLQEQLGNVDV